MKIYIDTNWFLGFYQSNAESVSVLESVAKRADLIVMTDQNRGEFHRNRAVLLTRLYEETAKAYRTTQYSTAVLRSIPSYSRVVQIAKELDEAIKALRTDITRMDALRADAVSIAFNEILTKCTLIEATDQDIARAQQRKLRGVPPSSTKRDTIGDEIIWECLLRACKEDLVIVSRDSDFIQHSNLLAEEFSAHDSRRAILLTTKLMSQVLKDFGKLTPEEYAQQFYTDPINRCQNCGASSWNSAGLDRGHAHLEAGRAAAGYPPLDPETKAVTNEHYVYVCGQCNSMMFMANFDEQPPTATKIAEPHSASDPAPVKS